MKVLDLNILQTNFNTKKLTNLTKKINKENKDKLFKISKKLEVMFYSMFFKEMRKTAFSGLSNDMTTSDYFNMFSNFFDIKLAETFSKRTNYKLAKNILKAYKK